MKVSSISWIRASVFIISFIAITCFTTDVLATHLRAGEITVERINCTSRTFRITVTVYTDTESTVQFGGTQDILDFGDGNRLLVPETPNTTYPGGGSIGFASRSFIHTFPGPGRYTISYIEPNRNIGVLNMANSVNTTFYIETQIDLSVLGCGNSPVLLVPPIDRACTGVAFYHNPGAYDPDGDSLSYELVVPFREPKTPVTAYRFPNDASFYPNFNQGNELGTGPPTFSINPSDGTLIWDAPSLTGTLQTGEFNIAFIVKEWRNINGGWVQIGFVRRDMQIIVERCTNERPLLEIPKDLCVIAGTTVEETIFGTDPENHNVKIEAFSEIFASDFPSRATYQPNPPVFQSSSPKAEFEFTWNTTCDHIKDQPYQIVFKITDNPPLGPKLVTFETWNITVIGPPPVLNTADEMADVTETKRHAVLAWEPYECVDKAATMQIWRRVGDTTYELDSCVTGMPEFLGYELIDEIAIRDDLGQPVTIYKDDNGLEAWTKYCYRLVATFPAPFGGESYVSNEVCSDPIESYSPIITKVSVDKTGDTDGMMRIEWVPPTNVSEITDPKYIVKRMSGSSWTSIHAGFLDVTFADDITLDTRDVQFFYRVFLHSGSNPVALDSSAIASSVFLDLKPQEGQIALQWKATVPWSNKLQAFPIHEIYRGSSTVPEADWGPPYATIDVLTEGFEFVDTGLDKDTEYCYRVKTRGGYDNPDIPEPLENWSQVNCALPIDDEPPCSPVVAKFADPCETQSNCTPGSYYNIISWSVPSSACEDEIRSYNIYVSGSENGTYTLLANVPKEQTTYEDGPLSSLAFCYKVTAVDRSSNESNLDDSEPICNTNCTKYVLPNVFTPGDENNKCNDLFRAFGDPLLKQGLGENAKCPYSDPLDSLCARFVQRVVFTVYNRWGKKVYDYIGQDDGNPLDPNHNSIYIRWDGRDNGGDELTTGVYYYTAEVTYNVIDPKQRIKQMKGWVHIIRPANFRATSN
jgi:hypothetical protein